MTHLSPFSYPQRLSIIGTALCAMILLNTVFDYRYMKQAVHKKDLKFWCMTLLGIHAVTWMMYDFTTTINVYYVNEVTGLGLASNTTSLRLKYFCDGLLDVAFTAHTSMLFLLISFWHTLFKGEIANKFVSRWEFKFYIVYSILSVALYPTLQWSLLVLDDPRLPTVVPQFLYFAELMLSSLLFLGVVYRMKSYARAHGNSKTLHLVTLLCRLIYLLVLSNLGIGVSLTILNIFYIIYPTPAEAHAALTMGVWDYLTGVFSMSFFSMIITTTLILNIRSVAKLTMPKEKHITVVKGSPSATSSKLESSSDV